MNTRHILIPIDFTKESNEGIASGLNLAKKIQGEIHLFHAMEKAEPENFRPSGDLQSREEDFRESSLFTEELIKKRTADLKDLAKQYGNEDVKIHTALRIGKFEDALEEFLQNNEMDIVVMGTSGETSFSEMFSGNHAAITMRESKIPVLTVKEETWFSQGAKLLLLIDLVNYKENVVKSIRDFAKMLDMKVLITHIKQKKDAIEEDINAKLEDFAKEHTFEHYSIHVVGKGNKVELVKDLAKEHDVEMVASISEGNSALVRLFFGSDTEDFINEVDKPMLAISE